MCTRSVRGPDRQPGKEAVDLAGGCAHCLGRREGVLLREPCVVKNKNQIQTKIQPMKNKEINCKFPILFPLQKTKAKECGCQGRRVGVQRQSLRSDSDRSKKRI